MLKHCVDHAASPRGKAALRRFAEENGGDRLDIGFGERPVHGR